VSSIIFEEDPAVRDYIQSSYQEVRDHPCIEKMVDLIISLQNMDNKGESDIMKKQNRLTKEQTSKLALYFEKNPNWDRAKIHSISKKLNI
jgi:hypothetical protein